MFDDRTQAGRILADRLAPLSLKNAVVFALPRGGVPVAAPIAERLSAPLDLVLVRKIGAPSQPELAIGAVTDGIEPECVFNQRIIRELGVTQTEIDAISAREKAEIERRRTLYLHDRPRVEARGRTVIVVDDGVATGATMKVALTALKKHAPARLILALPVAPPSVIAALKPLADDVICLESSDYFPGVGAFYRDFPQITDKAVIAILDRFPPHRENFSIQTPLGD